jgi:dephospho-CoA kinase
MRTYGTWVFIVFLARVLRRDASTRKGWPSETPPQTLMPSPRFRTNGVKVICVTGMPAAGKEEFQIVAASMGYAIVRMGDVVRDEARRRGLPVTDAAVGGMAHRERKEHGVAVWAERTIPLVRGDRVLIDGLRSLAELDAFRRAFGKDLVVFGIEASPRTRWDRVLSRRRPDDARTWEEFLRRDAREIGWGLDKVVAAADVRIVNEGSLDAFYARVREELRKLDA